MTMNCLIPEVKVDLIVPFGEISDLCRSALELLQRKIIPTTLELMDKKTIKACEKFLKRELPFNEAEVHL